jgi:hypothetical protein
VRLFVAVPAYDGKIGVETVRSLLNEQGAALLAGIEFQTMFLPGCSLITQARNQLAADFMASGADKLVFVDSDVSWEPGAIVKLASHDVDFVGGAYRLKQEAEAYPVGWLPDAELWAKDGLLEVASVPAGFMCLTRAVFARLKVSHPCRAYSHYEFQGHAYFHAPVKNGQLYGEDAAFCEDWREIGGTIWLDPELAITHHGGGQTYPGHIGNWLKSRITPAQLEAA